MNYYWFNNFSSEFISLKTRPVGLEPTTSGFGNQRSTDWTKDVFYYFVNRYFILKMSNPKINIKLLL